MGLPARERESATPRMAVRACGCGTIYLDIGSLTLRLDRDGLDAIARTVLEAQRRMIEMGDELPAISGVSCRPEMH